VPPLTVRHASGARRRALIDGEFPTKENRCAIIGGFEFQFFPLPLLIL
jgi:hypothetical protein